MDLGDGYFKIEGSTPSLGYTDRAGYDLMKSE
jgi:hypothetical protein